MKRWISLLLAALLALHMGAAMAQSYSQGDYADEIATIQQALTDLDLYYAGITGHFGERTEKAVRLFQKKAGLPQTGVADERTIELLYLRTGTQAPAAQTGSTGGTISVDQLLREGSTGSAVRALQEKLKALGDYDGTVTGRYGPLTKEAVRRFQWANGLTADGIAGPKTLTALGQLEAGGAAAGGSSLNGGGQGNDSLLRLNSSGSAVRALQTNLQTLGYYGGAVTGNYGRLTKEAVRVFQREHDLSADGVAGPRTLAAIQGELARDDLLGLGGEPSLVGELQLLDDVVVGLPELGQLGCEAADCGKRLVALGLGGGGPGGGAALPCLRQGPFGQPPLGRTGGRRPFEQPGPCPPHHRPAPPGGGHRRPAGPAPVGYGPGPLPRHPL